MSAVLAGQVLGVSFAQERAVPDTCMVVGSPVVPGCACEVRTRSSLEAFYAAVLVRLVDGSEHLLDGAAVSAALHLSGRGIGPRVDGETALAALVAGVEIAGVARLRELGRRELENNSAVLQGLIGAAEHRRVKRELWGSPRAYDGTLFGRLAVFHLLQDRLREACAAHRVPASIVSVGSLAVAR